MKRLLLVALFVLALAPTAHAEDALFRVSLVTAIAAHGADLATTEYCLGLGTCRETNPYLAHFTAQPATFGAIKMGVAGLSLWATAKIPNKTIATLVNFGMTALFAGVAVHNTRVTRR